MVKYGFPSGIFMKPLAHFDEGVTEAWCKFQEATCFSLEDRHFLHKTRSWWNSGILKQMFAKLVKIRRPTNICKTFITFSLRCLLNMMQISRSHLQQSGRCKFLNGAWILFSAFLQFILCKCHNLSTLSYFYKYK